MLERNELKCLKDLILKSCTKYMDNIAFLEKANVKQKEFKKIKYKDLQNDVINFSTALAKKYKLENEKIAIIGENSYKWMMSFLAVTTGPGVVVPLDKELPVNEIANLLRRSRAKCIIYSSKLKNKIIELKEEFDIIFIEMDKGKDENSDISIDEVIKEGKDLVENGDNWYKNQDVSGDDFRILVFTSGTTAESKGAMLSHNNIIANLEGALDIMQVDEKDTFFSILPMHHVYEMVVSCIYGLSNGSSIGICRGLKYVSKDMEELKPTVMICVPLLVEHICNKIDKALKEQNKTNTVNMLVKMTNILGKYGFELKRKIFSKIHDTMGGRLRYILVSAAPIEPKIIEKIEGYGYVIYQGYGLTETASLVSGTRKDDKYRTGTVGIPSDACEVKIDAEKGKDGEIFVRGKNVMMGYYENEKATQESIIDGWFRTGDVGHFNKRGNIVLTSRSKNVIVTSNGKNIYPEEIEAKINNIDLVKESMVYGEDSGKDLVLSVILTIDDDVLKEKYGDIKDNIEEIKNIIWNQIKEINSKNVSYKAIKSLKIKKSEFEKTTTMKIKRFVEKNKKE